MQKICQINQYLLTKSVFVEILFLGKYYRKLTSILKISIRKMSDLSGKNEQPFPEIGFKNILKNDKAQKKMLKTILI